jgi:5'-3' exonuclease
MPAPIILLDGNNLGFAAQQNKARLSVGEIETTAIYGVLRSLRLIREQFSGQPIMLWDGRSWRHQAFEGYKAGREARPEMVEQRDAWKAQRSLLGRILPSLGIHQAIATNLEADDLAARLRRHYRDRGHEIVLVSGDKDWWQLLETGVVVWDHVRDRLVTPQTFSEVTGLPTPYALAEFKALQGDRSDSIPGVGGIGEKTALALLNAYGSVATFSNVMMGDPKARENADKRALLLMDPTRSEGFDRNMELIWLDHPKAPRPEGLKLIKGSFDAEAFRAHCEEFAFFSVLRDFDLWTRLFSRKDQ